MVGEDIGWYPLDMIGVVYLLVVMGIAILVPGFLMTIAFFPKIKDFFDKLVFSFFLGLMPIFTIALLNMLFNFNLNTITAVSITLAYLSVAVWKYLKDKQVNGNTTIEDNSEGEQI